MFVTNYKTRTWFPVIFLISVKKNRVVIRRITFLLLKKKVIESAECQQTSVLVKRGIEKFPFLAANV